MRKISIKAIVTLLFTAVLSLCGGMLVGCKEPTTETNDPFTLNKTEIALLVGESTTIEADYTQKENQTLQFTSQNDSIATVSSAGVVTATSVGETKIVASYGKQSTECKVVVESGGLLPTLNLLYGVEDSVNCYVGEKVNLSANVFFNEKAYDDATITYSSSNAGVADVENGMLDPKALGTATITVTAKWRSFAEISKQITVEVIDTLICAVNGGRTSSFELYTVNQFRGETYENTATVNISLTDNGQTDISDYTVSVLDESVAKYQNGVLTAVGYGTTSLKISCTVNGKDYAFVYPVDVSRPTFQYEKVLDIDSVASFPVAEVFEDANAQIIDIRDLDGKTTLLVEDNVISGFTVDRTNLISHDLVVYTATSICEITVNPCTRVIRSFEDLQETFTVAGVATDNLGDVVYNGYYRLDGNVDCYGQKLANNSAKVFGLNGTFDGNGYVISNLTCGVQGIFGAVNGGTIKNVAFTGVRFPKNVKLANMSLFGSTAKDAVTYSDIYVEFAEETYDNFSMFTVLTSDRLASKSVVKNVVVDTSKVNLQLSGTNPSYGMYEVYYSELFKAEQVGSYEPTVLKNQRDIYIISKYYPAYIYGESYGLRVIDGANREGEEIQKFGVHNGVETSVYYFQTMKRYDSLQDFMSASDNDYTSFENGWWNVEGGAPIWNASATWDASHESLEMMLTDAPTTVSANLIYNGTHRTTPVADNDNVQITPLGNGRYSVAPKKVGLSKLTFSVEVDGQTFSYEMTVAVKCEEYGKTVYLDDQTALPSDIFGAGESIVSAVDLDGTTQVVLTADNKLQGFTVNGKTATVHEIVLCSSANNYKLVKVIPVTQIVTTYEQLSTIVKSGATTTGYYILGKDIDCSGKTVGVRSNNYRFEDATLDGNGYTVKNIKTQQMGFLGLIKNATIKNIAFTGVQYASGKTKAGVLGNIYENCIVQDVYIQFATQTIDNTEDTVTGTSKGFGVMGNVTINSKTMYQNIVIDISQVTLTDVSNTSIMGSDAAYIFNTYDENGGADQAFQPDLHKNIYIIGKANLMKYRGSNKVQILGASNGDIYVDDADTTTKILMRHSGVSRYDTADQYVEATKGGVDPSFGSLWAVNATNGLAWVGNQA